MASRHQMGWESSAGSTARPGPEEIPPHAPEGGWARRLLGRFHVTGVFWYKFHYWGMRFLPGWGVWVVVTFFTPLFFVALRRIRRALADNLEAVLGPCGWWRRQLRIYRSMWLFAWCLSERYERLATDRQFSLKIENLERWRAVGDSGQGLVMVTAHVGNFEVGSMLPSTRDQRRVHLVREKEVDPRAQEFVEQLLHSIPDANYTTHFESDDPLQGVPLLNALRRGEVVAVQGDRPRSGATPIDGRLFGRPFPLPSGPAALARAAGVPLMPVFVLRTRRLAYRVAFREPITVARTRDRRADLAAASQRIAEEVEWAIRQEPHQWFCFRNIWRPRGRER